MLLRKFVFIYLYSVLSLLLFVNIISLVFLMSLVLPSVDREKLSRARQVDAFALKKDACAKKICKSYRKQIIKTEFFSPRHLAIMCMLDVRRRPTCMPTATEQRGASTSDVEEWRREA
jgi:hypothetical protein